MQTIAKTKRQTEAMERPPEPRPRGMSFRTKVLGPVLLLLAGVSFAMAFLLTESYKRWAKSEEVRVHDAIRHFIDAYTASPALSPEHPELNDEFLTDVGRWTEAGVFESAMVFRPNGSLRQAFSGSGEAPEVSEQDLGACERIRAGEERIEHGSVVYVPIREQLTESSEIAITSGLFNYPVRGSPPAISGSFSPRRPRLIAIELVSKAQPKSKDFWNSVVLHFDTCLAPIVGRLSQSELTGVLEALCSFEERSFENSRGKVGWPEVSWMKQNINRDKLVFYFSGDRALGVLTPDTRDTVNFDPRRVADVLPMFDSSLKFAPAPAKARLIGAGNFRIPAPDGERGAFPQPAEMKAPILLSITLEDGNGAPGLGDGDRVSFRFSNSTSFQVEAMEKFLLSGTESEALGYFFPLDDGEVWPPVTSVTFQGARDVIFEFDSPREGADLSKFVKPGSRILGVRGHPVDPELNIWFAEVGALSTEIGYDHIATVSYMSSFILGSLDPLMFPQSPQLVRATALNLSGTEGVSSGDKLLLEFSGKTNHYKFGSRQTQDISENLGEILLIDGLPGWSGVRSASWKDFAREVGIVKMITDSLEITFGDNADESMNSLVGREIGIKVAPADTRALVFVLKMKMSLHPGDAQGALTESQWQFGLVMAIGSGLIVILAYVLLSALVLRPLEGLSLASEGIIRGDYSFAPKETKRADEIGHLQNAFSRMMNEVLAYQDELESRVDSASKRIEETQKGLIVAQRLAAMGTLASGIAHEINNPIGGMLNAVRMLAQRARKSNEERSEVYLELIHEGLTRIEATVQNLLQFSPRRKSELGKMNLKHAAESAISFKRSECISKGIEIRFDWDEKASFIHGNAHEIQQVFLNLVINSLQAIESRGEIEFSAKLANDLVVVRVRDTGKGMTKEEQERAFDIFFTTKPQGKGTGLGLFIVHQVVSNHGGTIQIESEPGKGTTFILSFPAAPE
ncbi:MAG: HAMP domain-containing histidine kinase [Planctomycetes bacterium]|nr:HAMP domain-containing histidine kinase [Planctomycetota bacterium]